MTPATSLVSIHRSALLSDVASAPVYLADLTRGPTGSWCDFFASGAIAEALAQGIDRVVVASTGNHGLAVAHAGHAAGIRVCVLTYSSTPAQVREAISAAGAEVMLYERPDQLQSALRARIGQNWFSASLTDDDRARTTRKMPGAPGFALVAEAIASQVGGKPLIVAPTCHGDGAMALADAFRLRYSILPTFCLIRAQEPQGAFGVTISTDKETPQVRALLARGGFSMRFTDAEFRDGLSVVQKEVGFIPDAAAGGIPIALERLRGRTEPGHVAVCLVTGRSRESLRRQMGYQQGERGADI